MSARTTRLVRLAVVACLTGLAMTACAPEGGSTPPAPTPPSSSAPSASASPTASPTPTAVAARIPSDCKAMLSADVLAQLSSVPLNDPAVGATGVQSDGSLVCIWHDPAADTTSLETRITKMDRGPALDMLNALVADEGFSCYTPDSGTRCEKTWINAQYPVNDGRTLFWRDDVLVDTRYSNLAPTGYTASIIASIFG